MALAALALGAPAVVASAAGEPEKPVCLVASLDSCPEKIELSVAAAEFKPRRLPKKAMLPVAIHFRAALATPNGKVPRPLRTIEIALDKNASVDVRGLPACPAKVLKSNAGRARSLCRGSIVGTGVAHVAAASSQQPVALPLTLFNGGSGERATKLFVWSVAANVSPRPLLAVARLRESNEGRYATKGTVEIPPLAGGSGSVLDLRLDLKRGYVKARCFDGRLQTVLTLGFASGLMSQGALIQVCQTRMGAT